jgi:hypothetical protein
LQKKILVGKDFFLEPEFWARWNVPIGGRDFRGALPCRERVIRADLHGEECGHAQEGCGKGDVEDRRKTIAAALSAPVGRPLIDQFEAVMDRENR